MISKMAMATSAADGSSTRGRRRVRGGGVAMDVRVRVGFGADDFGEDRGGTRERHRGCRARGDRTLVSGVGEPEERVV